MTHSVLLDDSRMLKPVDQIRREHFVRMVNECPGDKQSDRINVFAERTGMNTDYIRQLMNGKGKSGGRNIGHPGARKLEELLGLEPNSLDQDPTAGAAKPPSTPDIRDAMSGVGRDAIAFALTSLFSSTAVSRPREAQELAASMRTKGKALLRDPFVRHILGILDSAAAAPKAGSRR